MTDPAISRRAHLATPRPGPSARRLAPILSACALVALAGCGSSTTTVIVTPPPATASATASGSSTSSAASSSTATSSSSTASGPVIELIWVVQTAGHQVIRRATPGGGAASTIATLGANEFTIAVGHGHAVTAGSSGGSGGDLRVLSTATGATTATGHFTGNPPLGAAISPDGTHMVFIDAVPNGGTVKVMDLATGAVSPLHTYGSSPVPTPTVWAADAVAGVLIVPNSDAGPQGVAGLGVTSGATTATTATAGAGGDVATADAHHGFAVVHKPLGDDADAQPGPGPQGPFNTLQSFSIGAAPATLLSEAHHTISVLATLPAGDSVLIDDDTAAGAFAGISLSPDFGLIVVTGGTKHQYRTYDGTAYDSGAFYQDGSTVAVASHNPAGSRLIQYAPGGGAPVTLDNVAGGQSATVYLVPGA